MVNRTFEQRMKLRKLVVYLSLLVLGLFGLLALHFENPYYQHLGFAFVIAAILGGTVDIFLKQHLADDAVSAALGYLLPDELRRELTWVYDQKFLVTQTFNVRLEHLPEHNAVRFHGHVVRSLKNISGEKAPAIFSGGVEEWFHPIEESRIVASYYTLMGQTHVSEPQRIDTHLTYGDPEKEIWVGRDETLEWVFSYVSVLSENGMEVLTHRYPIVNALVTVDVPPTLMASVTYSHREKFATGHPLSTGFISVPLNGVLLPHQDIRIYWYLADNIQRRRGRGEKA